MKLSPERSALVLQFLPHARAVARAATRHLPSLCVQDQAFAAAEDALIALAASWTLTPLDDRSGSAWDDCGPVGFATSVGRAARRAICAAVSKEFDHVIGGRFGKVRRTLLHDAVPARPPADPVHWSDADWDRLLAPLTPPCRTLVTLHFREGYSLHVAAALAGIRPKRHLRSLRESLDLLRDRVPR